MCLTPCLCGHEVEGKVHSLPAFILSSKAVILTSQNETGEAQKQMKSVCPLRLTAHLLMTLLLHISDFSLQSCLLFPVWTSCKLGSGLLEAGWNWRKYLRLPSVLTQQPCQQLILPVSGLVLGLTTSSATSNTHWVFLLMPSVCFCGLVLLTNIILDSEITISLFICYVQI